MKLISVKQPQLSLKKNKLKFSVTVTLKNMGYDNIINVRQGKYFEIELNENNQKIAEDKVNEMCKKLLANLIIEDYKVNKI